MLTPDPATPLAEVPFCVLDLETTGLDPTFDEITEVGVVKVLGGQRLGTFHTFTGASCIPVDTMLPNLLEFVRGTVIAGHNVRFDLRFLNSALARSGRPLLAVDGAIDTMPLARKLVRDEVGDCRLSTLAHRFELDHRPSHRAFEDAAATVDLLHVLIEQSSAYGVTALDDLRALPSIAAHRHAAKLRLTAQLPRSPGVFMCHGEADAVLYVGVALELRGEVRAMFDGREGRIFGPVLRDTQRFSFLQLDAPLAREIARVRLLHHHRPRHQRTELAGDRACYLHVDPTARAPRVSVVSEPRSSGWHVGPIAQRTQARLAAQAIRDLANSIGPTWPDTVRQAVDAAVDPGELVRHWRQEADRLETMCPIDAAVHRGRSGAAYAVIAEHRRLESARRSAMTTGCAASGVHIPPAPGEQPLPDRPLPRVWLDEVTLIADALASDQAALDLNRCADPAGT